MADGQTRAIPRPSERGRRPATAGLDAIDLREQQRGSDRNDHRASASRTHASDGPRSRDGALRSTFTTIAAVSALAASVAFGVLGLTGREDTTAGLIVAPLLTVCAWASVNKWVRPRLGDVPAAVLIAGFGLRMLAAVPRLLGGADSPIYQLEGERIARELRRFDFAVNTGRAIPGTGAVRYFTGVVNVFTGSTYIATFLVFATIAFIGQVFFLFATRRALTDKQFRILATTMMCSPTLVFWPSSIGKESLSLFGIGLGAYGAALLYDRQWNGAWPVLLGVFSVGVVRPHVAMILLLGLLVGLFARRAHTRGRAATHLLFLIAIVIGSMYLASASAGLVGVESLDGLGDVNDALDFAQARTSQDESRFAAARVESPVDYPWAAVTVLFRPFPWEADSGASMISAVESIFLMLLAIRALPGLLNNSAAFVQRGQMLYSVSFIAVFVFLFSAIGNFGILSRQRSQVIPFVLLFVAFGIGAERVRTRKTKTRRNP